jgi:hypothetical protein
MAKRPSRLSAIQIDIAKNWGGYPISNIGAPPADTDVLPRGLIE